MTLALTTLATSIFNRLFGLEGLGFGDESVHLELTRSVPAWGWVLVVLGSVGLAAWSYRRLTGPVWARSGLAAVRALVLLILVVLAAGPRLARPNERIEPDWVIVLVDRSASLTIRDVARAADPSSERSSRDEQLRAALARAWPQLGAMADRRHVLWMGFGGGAFDLAIQRADDGSTSLDLGEADERRTALGAALDQALRRTSGRRVSGIVVISDGRSVDEPSRAALRRLEAQRIRVLTIALGSDEPIADLALHLVDAPDEAFARDPVPIRVVVDRLGSGDGEGGEVRLVDAATGTVLDRHTIEPGPAGRIELTLSTMPLQAERARWRVEIVPAGVDLVASNNAATVETTISDRPLRVVYFDGYPRWEYRFVKNLLLRERSILSSAMLLAANRRYLQEGDIPLTSVPRSPEEWAPFDVVVMGDVRAEVFSDRQREQLLDHVAIRGGGVLFIAGPGAMPGSFRSTVLGDLLPFTADGVAGRGSRTMAVWDERVTVYPSPLAERLGVLRLGDDAGESADGTIQPSPVSDPAAGWSQLRWVQRIDPALLKPTAEVLAWAAPVGAYAASMGGRKIPESATPMVITMRYGAGRVVYVATDEIWRWRYGRGEALPERFWIPLIRLLGRQSLARSGLAATLEATPTTAQVDQPIRLTVRLLDQSLVDARAGTIRVRLDRIDDIGADGIDLELARDRAGADSASVVTYGTTWRVPVPGRYRATVVDPLLVSLGLEVQLRVLVEDDEMRKPQTDHEALARLARAGDGQGVMLDPSQLGSVPDLLPVREVRIESAPDLATLWDRPIVLVVLMVLLAIEWMGRKLVSLA